MTAPKDFSKKRTDITFTIDDDVFEAWPVLPVEMLMDALEASSNIMSGEGKESLHALFTIFLKPDSAKRFITRLSDPENPIELEQMDNIIEWLMECYGRRPTQPSGNSSDGSENQDTGTSSTETSPQSALTSVN